jgi:hypothetical protein
MSIGFASSFFTLLFFVVCRRVFFLLLYFIWYSRRLLKRLQRRRRRRCMDKLERARRRNLISPAAASDKLSSASRLESNLYKWVRENERATTNSAPNFCANYAAFAF